MVENQCDSNCTISNRVGEKVNYCYNYSNACGCQTATDNCNDCSCGEDLIETARQLLESSFFTALKEVHVEKIKKIILEKVEFCILYIKYNINFIVLFRLPISIDLNYLM